LAGASQLPANRPNWNDGAGARQDYMNDRVANRQERANNLQDNMQGRQDNRQANRETRQGDRQGNRGDRQENRQTNREDRQDNRGDWQENFWDNAHDAYHDNWHGDYGDYWDHMWEYHPVASAFAVTGWGINRLSYWFGYGGGYGNPYYGDSGSYGGGGSYDYSQPLPTYEQVSMPAETAAPAETVAAASDAEVTPLAKAYDEARQAFYEGDYVKALERTNAALAIAPYDAVLHEFKALTLFASGKYHDAAVTIHTVLAVGPGWDWTTLIRMYPNVDTYTAQLRALESAVNTNPKSADLHFLLAYHYVTCSSTTEAVAQLQEVAELEPKDTVAVQLLQMIGGPSSLPKSSSSQTPPKAAPPAGGTTIPKKDLVGNWKAKGDGDASFGLKLADDNTFAWTYAAKGKSKTIEGVYGVEQNSLALQPDAGGVMVAELTPPTNGKFHFQVAGGPPGDKGLDFSK